jgi:pachytene checkpoint protein 2
VRICRSASRRGAAGAQPAPLPGHIPCARAADSLPDVACALPVPSNPPPTRPPSRRSLFAHIGELVADEDSLVFLLIDEVESLTAARRAAVSGSEPSDAVRVVNAVLTAIDSFRTRRNVLLLTTSNVSEAIDVAFVDRADIKAHVGPPGAVARYDILASCVGELVRVGLVTLAVTGARLAPAAEARALVRGTWTDGGAAAAAAPADGASAAPPPTVDRAASAALWRAAEAADGFSGRTLRKLPLQAHAMYVRARGAVSGTDFAAALLRGVRAERGARAGFADA